MAAAAAAGSRYSSDYASSLSLGDSIQSAEEDEEWSQVVCVGSGK